MDRTDFIYRVYDENSHGENHPTLFRPASYNHQSSLSLGERQPHQLLNFARALESALAWKMQLPDCPFLFFTRSFLFAIVYAGYRKATGRGTNVVIVCVNTATATTETGRPAQFHAVSDMIEEFGANLRRCKDGSPRQYAHEMVATTPVVPGEGSIHVPYSTLVVSGLYDFYPALGEVYKRESPRLNLAVEDLRKYGFERQWPLTREKVPVAVRLAGCFFDCVTNESLLSLVKPMEAILAAILALQKRAVDDTALRDPTLIYNAITGPNAPKPSETSPPAALPEVQNHIQLQTRLHGVTMNAKRIHIPPSVNEIGTRGEIAAWHSWWRQNREAYRLSHPRQDRAFEHRARERDHGWESLPRGDRERRSRHEYQSRSFDRTQYGRVDKVRRRRDDYSGRREITGEYRMRHRH